VKALRLLVPVACLGAVAVSALSAQARTASPSARCTTGTVPAIVNHVTQCLKAGAKCQPRFERTYRSKGFHCAAGHLRKLPSTAPHTTTPAPAPPTTAEQPAPPPPPSARYQGTTSQGESVQFEISADGTFVQNLQTGQVNETCTPTATLYGGNLKGGAAPLAADGTFSMNGSGNGTVGADPTAYTLSITGHVANGAASGTIAVTNTFAHDGVQYSCTSGNQTWTATLVQ